MGRIFLSAGRGAGDSGAIAGGTTEAQQMILLRDQVVPEVRSKGIEILAVPDSEDTQGTIIWINNRAKSGDVALEIYTGAFSNPAVRGASVFYITNNEERRNQAELMLVALLRRVPQLPSRGARPDTSVGVGRIGFCRDVIVPSLVMEVGFLTNPDDRFMIINRRRDLAMGIAEGLVTWSKTVDATAPKDTISYQPINISINGQIYGEKGVIINNNAYIPIDLLDLLGIKLIKGSIIRRVPYRGIVYVKAVELRDFNISVSWDGASRTVNLRSILQICIGQIDRIMNRGNTSEVQLIMFLKSNNPDSLNQFPDLPKLYREEASIEGVNYDLAFCQMCVETGFLRFSGEVKLSQNNFAGLGGVGNEDLASFSSARLGVRAHIQHLKAYGSVEPLVQEVIDPRFRFVTRGIAPLIEQLSGRWSADLQYGARIIAVLRRLYESANLL